MRRHRAFAALAAGVTAARVRTLVRSESLVAARLEGVLHFGRPAAVVDALFLRGDELLSVPLLVPTMRAAMREAEPFIWPARVAEALDDDAADTIDAILAPWVFGQLAGRASAGEAHVAFSAAGERAFAQARALGLPGAAPLDRVARALAPALAIAPFVRGRVVLVQQADGLATYGVLASAGAKPFLREADPNDAFAARWFGIADAKAAPDVATGDMDDALFVRGAVPDLTFLACDPLVGLATNGLRVPRRIVMGTGTVVAPAAASSVGARSSGIIALGVRDDGLIHPDADTAAAEALGGRLRSEGLTVVTAPLAETGTVAFDLVHIVGSERPDYALAALRRAHAAGKLVVVSALHVEGTEDAVWGARTAVQVVAHRADDVGLEPLFAALAARRLETDVSPTAAALAEQLARDRRLLLAEADAVCDIAPFVDDGEPLAIRLDALAVTAIEPRANLVAAALAAADAGLRLVLVGPIVDPAYFAFVAAFGGASLAYLGDLPEADVARLIASANVYVDVAWSSRGPARVRAAARAAAAVVHSGRTGATELAGEGAYAVDPASIEEIARALRLAAASDSASRAHLRERSRAIAHGASATTAVLDLYATLADRVLN